jgi:hypothetical protein
MRRATRSDLLELGWMRSHVDIRDHHLDHRLGLVRPHRLQDLLAQVAALVGALDTTHTNTVDMQLLRSKTVRRS